MLRIYFFFFLLDSLKKVEVRCCFIAVAAPPQTTDRQTGEPSQRRVGVQEWLLFSGAGGIGARVFVRHHQT